MEKDTAASMVALPSVGRRCSWVPRPPPPSRAQRRRCPCCPQTPACWRRALGAAPRRAARCPWQGRRPTALRGTGSPSSDGGRAQCVVAAARTVGGPMDRTHGSTLGRQQFSLLVTLSIILTQTQPVPLTLRQQDDLDVQASRWSGGTGTATTCHHDTTEAFKAAVARSTTVQAER
jgi:hypothetical protein